MIAALQVKNLSLSASGRPLLDRLQLILPQGEISLILGPNGAGKTLLLRCLAGVLEAHSGEVFIGHPGESLSRKPRHDTAKLLTWMPLSSSLPFAFTVWDMLIMGRYPHHQGFPGADDKRFAQDALERLGLQKFAKRVYNSLSRGEQTRVDIARALATNTPIMLFDEPFANLDIDASLQMIRLFQDMRREGKTLILSHHDLYSARDLATHMVFLRKGQLIASGSSPEIFTPDIIRQTYEVEARVREDALSGEWFVRFDHLSL